MILDMSNGAPTALRWPYPLRAAAVGGCLAALWLLVAYAASSPPLCGYSLGCAFVLSFAYWVAPVIGAVVAWPLLRWAGLRPAWLVALLGGVIGLLGTRAGESLAHRVIMASWWLVPILAAAYAIAAYVVLARIRLAWRALLVVAALLPLPIAELTADMRAAGAEQDMLAQAGVPLLGPDVPDGYRIRRPGAREHMFFYSLQPTATGATPDPDTEDKAAIRVTVAPVAPTFAPPNRCTVEGFVGITDYAPPCPPVGDNIWRWSNYDSVSYFVRRGSVMVVVERHSDQVPEDVLREITRTLSPRDSSYFTEN